MVCSLCNRPGHARNCCPTVFCKQIIHEVFDQTFTVKAVPFQNRGFPKQLFLHFLCGLFDLNSPISIIANRSDDIIRAIWQMSDFFDTSVNTSKEKLTPIMHCLCFSYRSGSHVFLPNGNNVNPHSISINPHRTILQVFNDTHKIVFSVHNIETNSYTEIMNNYSNAHSGGMSRITAFGYSTHNNFLITHNNESILKLYKCSDHKYRDIDYFKPEWKKLLSHTIEHPIIISKEVCIVAYRTIRTSGIARINLETGDTVWETLITQKGHTVCSPWINHNIIIYATEYCIFRIDIHTGDILSTLQMKDQCIQYNGIFYSKQEDTVYALLYKKGVFKEKNWMVSSFTPYVESMITSCKDRIIVADNVKNIHCLRKRNGSILWTIKIGTHILQNIAISTCKTYAVICGENKQFLKIRTDNGNIMWTKKLHGTVYDRVFSSCSYYFLSTYDKYHNQYSILS